MAAKPTTLKQYLTGIAPDRKEMIEALRGVINKNIDKKFEEGMQYGMPAWYLPHSVFPAGYHCDPSQPLPFIGLASQKNHLGLYLFCIYTDSSESIRFQEEWKATGKRLDMGKSCVRVKNMEGIPLAVIGRVIKRMTAKKFVAAYQATLSTPSPKKRTTRKASKKTTKKGGKKASKTSTRSTKKKVAKAPK